MAAAQAVLDIYELFEEIATYLKTEDVYRLQRVSKTWQAMLTRSSRLRDLRIPPPLSKADAQFAAKLGDPTSRCYTVFHSSIYDVENRKMQPSPLASGRCIVGEGIVDNDLLFPLQYRIWDFVRSSQPPPVLPFRFVTSPPVQALQLTICYAGNEMVYCTVYERTGVTTEHIRLVWRSLLVNSPSVRWMHMRLAHKIRDGRDSA